MAKKDPFGFVGATIENKFRIDEVVGEGGFGVVYRGHHLGFEEAVAVKCLKLPAALEGEEREQFHKTFLEEGRLLHRLSRATAGIVQALDVGATTSPTGIWTPYLVLEWLQGSPLDVDLQARRSQNLGGRGLAEAIELLSPAARALDVAHEQGVAHRDVKPANLFLAELGDKRTVKVLDFGIAKVLGEMATLTQQLAETGASVKAFTPQYGAPEQFHRKYGATGPWTDVYALALVLVEVVTGRHALDGADTTQLYIASTDPMSRPTLRGVRAEVSDAVEAVLARALAVDPRDRYLRAGAFWDDLVAAMPEGAVRRDPSISGGKARTASAPEMPEGWRAMPTGEFIAQHEGELPPQSAGSIGEASKSDAKGKSSNGGAAGGPKPQSPLSASIAKDTVKDAASAPTALAASWAGQTELAGAGERISTSKPVTVEPPARSGVEVSRERDRAGTPPAAARSSFLPVVVSVVLLGAGGAAYWALRPQTPAPASPVATVVVPPPSASVAVPDKGPEMVRVPAGSFLMGSADGGKTERPVHKVTFTHAFDIDRTEVTAADYERCAAAGKCAPSSIHGPKVDDDEIAKLLPLCTSLDPSKKLHPINCIDQAQAAAYCKFAGKRLPSEAEWEYAARGADGRQYPWGNESPSCGSAVISRGPNDACPRPRSTSEVGIADGKSPFGAVDMAGNVWEWVADGWDPNVYAKGAQTDPVVPPTADNGVLRGGSWDFAAMAAKSTFRLSFNRASASVSTGVRCAKTVE